MHAPYYPPVGEGSDEFEWGRGSIKYLTDSPEVKGKEGEKRKRRERDGDFV